MTYMLVGLAIFGALLMAARATKHTDVILSAIVLSVVWVSWSLFIEISHNYEPWVFGIFLDGAAAYVLTLPGASRQRGFLAVVYAIQIMVHIMYGYETIGLKEPPYGLYSNVLDILALLQIAFVGGWCGFDLLRGRGVHPMDRDTQDSLHIRRKGGS